MSRTASPPAVPQLPPQPSTGSSATATTLAAPLATTPVVAPATEPAAFYKPGAYTPDQSIGYLMRRVLTSILAEADKELAPHDLTHAQWLPLYKISMEEGCTMAALARNLCIDPSAMTRSLDRLENKGLLERKRSVADRRVVHLNLTPEGHRVARDVPAVMADVLNGHLSGFSEPEWRQLTGMLQRMLANGEALRSVNSTAATPPEAG